MTQKEYDTNVKIALALGFRRYAIKVHTGGASKRIQMAWSYPKEWMWYACETPTYKLPDFLKLLGIARTVIETSRDWVYESADIDTSIGMNDELQADIDKWLSKKW